MKLHRMFGIGALMLSFAAGSAFAQDKAARQAETVKVAQGSLQRSYETRPDLKDSVDSFTLTKNGLEAGVAIQASTFWRPDELN